MTKFKKGDRVRYIGDASWKFNWLDCVVVKQEVSATTVESVYLKKMGKLSTGSINTCDLELIPSTTFEVGKTYHVKKTKTGILDDKLFTVLFITDTGHTVLRWNHDSKEVIWRPGAAIEWEIVEYIPPPPEEWRALFYVENRKPEVSAYFASSKSEVEEQWKHNKKFMYAIRTDINAKKEN
jgi:acyl-CoA hydrolase